MNRTMNLLGGLCVAAGCAGCASSVELTPVTLYVAAAAETDGGIVAAVYRPETEEWSSRRMLDCPRVNYLAYDATGTHGFFSQGGAAAGVGCWRDYNVLPRSSGGAECCHLIASPDGNFLYAANYSGGNFTEFPLEKGFAGQPRVLTTPPPSGEASARQEASHPHQCQFTPDGRFLAVVDLGLNVVLCYPYDAVAGVAATPAAENPLHAGAGPRHLVFSSDGMRAYVANELDNTVSMMAYQDGTLTELAHMELRQGEGAEPRDYPAAIRLTRDNRWLLVSIRGEDRIAVLALDAEGQMGEPRFFDCGGRWPRDFALSPDERWVAVANEHSGSVRLFRWDGENGTLTPEAVELAVPQASAVLF